MFQLQWDQPFIIKTSRLRYSSESAKLRAYAPYPSMIRASLLINTRLTRLYPHQKAPHVPFFCLVLCCFNQKVGCLCFVCALKSTICPRISLLSFILPSKSVLHAFFFFFYFKAFLHHYLYNYFATTFSHFLLSFLNKLT